MFEREYGTVDAGTYSPETHQSATHDNNLGTLRTQKETLCTTPQLELTFSKNTQCTIILNPLNTFSLIFSYFCFLLPALSPCHGRLPRLKYIRTYPKDSISSRRLCSIPNNYSTLCMQKVNYPYVR